MKGCLITVGILAVILLICGIVVAYKWKGWAASATTLVAEPGAGPGTLPLLAEHCKAQGLAVQKIPERLEVVDALPRNTSGKVMKHVLRDQVAEMLGSGS